MNKIKLTIQNGHRNVTNGQTGTSGVTSAGQALSEVDFIDKVFNVIKDKIAADSSLSSKIDLSYDDCNVVNGQVADYFMAVHADGAGSPDYNGGFIDDTPDDHVAALSWKWAQTVADTYFPRIGIRFAPEHRTPNSTYYYAFNSTGYSTKQFIIECGAMTNKADMDKLYDTQYVGSLLLEGIVNYFKQVEPIFQVVPPTPPTPTDPCQLYKDQVISKDKVISDKDLTINFLNQSISTLTTEVESLKKQLAAVPPPVTLTDCSSYINQIAFVHDTIWGKGWWWTRVSKLQAVFPK